jgi:wyosine [tRNA(Phe)-imidazoG37] synthetase (radical SAM superfamily)
VEEVSDHTAGSAEGHQPKRALPARSGGAPETAFGSPRDFLDNRFVYVVVSARARGMCIGVNVNPEKRCNFNCVYCEVHRNGDPLKELEVDVMEAELKRTLNYVRTGRLRERPWYRGLPDELLQLRHVALSGDGEPTLSPHFSEALQAVSHVRASSGLPFFKLVLLTNATGLNEHSVVQGLKSLTRSDEVWAKLDGGTQAYLNKVNRADVPLTRILNNILTLGQQRPIVIQSLFPSIHHEEPPLAELEQYAQRLLELKKGGATISLVQIYSAMRPAPNSEFGHLPLRVLSRIAELVRKRAGLLAEVF